MQGAEVLLEDGKTAQGVVVLNAAGANALASDMATAPNQLIANETLGNIDGKLPPLVNGQIPVSLGGATITITGDVGVISTVEITNDAGNPIPMTAADLPLPDGAATALNQVTELGYLADISDSLPDLVLGRIPTDGSGVTQPISASALPLPVGASTETKQDAGNTLLSSILSAAGAQSDTVATSDTGNFSILAYAKLNATKITTLLSRLPALVSGRIPVDGSNVTQPISASALPLPTGAAVETKQDTGNNTLSAISAGVGAPADAVATTDTGTYSYIALFKKLLTGFTTLLSRTPALVNGRIPVDGSGATQPISASALPLPTGAATSSLQTDTNTSIVAFNDDVGQRADVVATADTGVWSLIAMAKRNQQRWTSFFGLFPSALDDDRIKVTSQPRANNWGVSANQGVNVAMTLSIPIFTDQRHYIDKVYIALYSSAARTGSATPIIITTTNLPGGPSYVVPTEAAIGSLFTLIVDNNSPIRSNTAGAATTFVCPAVPGGQWRGNVQYFTAP
jgi:hypothetical protein